MRVASYSQIFQRMHRKDLFIGKFDKNDAIQIFVFKFTIFSERMTRALDCDNIDVSGTFYRCGCLFEQMANILWSEYTFLSGKVLFITT